MTRWIAALITSLFSLMAVGYSPDDPTVVQAPTGSTGTKSEKKQRVEVRVIQKSDEGDAAAVLADTYELLRRLRAEEFEGRPKELLDRAVEMYRRAVENYTSDDEAKAKTAAGLAVAAQQLARTVERLNDVRRADRPDPDLPPPPAARNAPKGETKAVITRLEALPPLLERETGDGKAVTKEEKRVFIVRPEPGNESRVFVFDGKGELETDDVRGKLDLPRAVGGVVNIDVQVDEKKIRELTEELQQKAREAAERALHGNEPAHRLLTWVWGDGPEQARAELKRAYDRITAAREEASGEEAKFYLDAARDLYNTARQDEEAGRHERAAELARAAIALTLVPKNLAGTRDVDKEDDEAGERDEKPEARREGIRAREREAEIKEKLAEAREKLKDAVEREAMARAEASSGKKGEIEFELHLGDQKEPGEVKNAIGGIGVAFSFEDGELEVLEVVPGTPAAESGKIHPGDRVVGVMKGDERQSFDGMEREKMVDMLRGKPGTRVSIVVRHEEKDEEEVVELTRALIQFPGTAGEGGSQAIEEVIKILPEELKERVAPAEEPLPPAIP